MIDLHFVGKKTESEDLVVDHKLGTKQRVDILTMPLVLKAFLALQHNLVENSHELEGYGRMLCEIFKIFG